MPFFSFESLKIYKFSILENHGLYHAIYTRQGGFSPTPWYSLNFGASVGDDFTRVMKNREIALYAMKLNTKSVFDVYQVHSTNIVVTDRPLFMGESHQRADAILSNKPNVTLMMRFADCVPILLFDRKRRAIGLVHAGWVGTVEKILKHAILRMIDVYGTNPNDLVAAIGPSIGPDHYAIGEDVITRVRSSFGKQADNILIKNHTKVYFDLWKANQQILTDMDVDNVEISELCTACNLDNWYSHRGEHGRTGRFGVIFGIQE